MLALILASALSLTPQTRSATTPATTPAAAVPSMPASHRRIDLKGAQVSFELASEDGELTYACTPTYQPSTEDFHVSCVNGIEPRRSKLEFGAHLRLFVHERPTAPKLSYELLYWVTDEQLVGGQNGEFTGSTIWFNLEEKSALHSLDAGQTVENSLSLTAHVAL